MNRFLTSTKDINKSAVVWNMVACTSYSFQSIILMLVMTRSGNYNDSAIFSIAYATASLLLFIGKYSVRNYQVSDVKNEFTYGEYCYARVLTTIGMMLLAGVYMVYCHMEKAYDSYKIICCVLIISVRALESFEDVFHGDLQRNGRLDIVSKICSVRNLGFIVGFIVSYLVSGRLVIAASFGLIITFLLFVILNVSVYNLFEKNLKINKKRVLVLLKNCWPLALSSIITVYIGNSPKYAVDSILTSEQQTCFNVIFMPVFVFSLFGNYMFIPVINKLTALWNDQNKKEFKYIILRQLFILGIFTGIVIWGGEIIGIRLLEILYSISLQEYKVPFIFLMIAGEELAILNLLIIIFTILRKTKLIQYAILCAALFFVLFSKAVLRNFGILVLCIYFCAIISVLTIFMLTLLYKNGFNLMKRK